MQGNIQVVLNRIQQIEQRFNPRQTLLGSKAHVTFAQTLAAVSNSKEPGDVIQTIDKTAQRYGIDPALAKAVAKVESNHDATAVSEAGALGVMQLMPETAKQMGVSNPLNAHENIEGGVRYLKELLEKYSGNTALALAAYNAGPGSVEKYGGIPPYQETQHYVAKVLEQYRQYK